VTEANTRHRTVVLHASGDPADVSPAVTAANSLAETHPDVAVRVIVNGPALEGVTSAGVTLTPMEGTTVEACSLGMQRRSMSTDQLQPAVHTVASAVTAIVDAQVEGASYVRL
jgi:intracellular sulfur oxidation DsrE/DsrF family protein